MGSSLNTHALYGLIGTVLIMIYLNYMKNSTQKKNILDKSIPQSSYIHYGDLEKFFISAQNFYKYNPQAYEDFIEQFDSFMLLHSAADPRASCRNYNSLMDKKKSIMFAFDSISLNLTPELVRKTGFANCSKKLNNLLDTYLQNAMDLCKETIKQFGYSVSTELPKTGPVAYNDDSYIFD